MHLLFENSFCNGEGDVWIDIPTPRGIIVYSVITPAICLFGICGNILSLLVLLRKEFKASIYTYLLVLATTDLANSIILFVCGLCRGVLWFIPGFSEYEALISLPLGGAIGNLAVIATVSVAVDRVVYLWEPMRSVKPKYCQKSVARQIMFSGLLIAVLFNIPYCFIFEWSEDGRLITTPFFDTTYYFVHNWIKFIIFAVIPLIILVCGNSFLIYTLKQANKIKHLCRKRLCCTVIKKSQDQKRVTVTLVAIVFFFLIGEIPTHLASRTTAVTILFSGDEDEADRSEALEIFRQVSTVLNAINIAANFVIYCMFCPVFRSSLKKMLSSRRKKIRANNLQVNVFILNGKRIEEKGNFKLPVSNAKLFGLWELHDKNAIGTPQPKSL